MGARAADADGLTALQVRAVAALAAEPSVAAAARAVGKSESTLHRWLREPAFKAALARCRRAALEAGLQAINGLVAEAVETLRACLSCGNPAVAVRAAVAVLDKAVNGQALTDVAEEVDALRAALAQATALADGVLPYPRPPAPAGASPPPEASAGAASAATSPSDPPVLSGPGPAEGSPEGLDLLFPPPAG